LTIYIFIPVSGCVGRDPSALLCPGTYNAVKRTGLCVYPMYAYYPQGRKLTKLIRNYKF